MMKESTKKLEEMIRGRLDLIDVKNGKQSVLVRVRGRRKLLSFMVLILFFVSVFEKDDAMFYVFLLADNFC